jgi:acyl-CoA thioesterase-1
MPHPGRIVLVALLAACGLAAIADAQNKQKAKKRRPNPAFAKVADDPKLPRVLLIGDSISIGYTVPVRDLLKGKANVHRIPTNGGPTTRGVQMIDRWLGDGKWDVIHFNWGLHDLKYISGKHQVSPEDYGKNLRTLVARLKKTGAKLIWCSTTPVPKGVSPPRTNDDVLRYNAMAAKIMKAEGVPTNDLYSFAAKRLEKIQRPRNVHFTPAGSKTLATQVAGSIETALKKR